MARSKLRRFHKKARRNASLPGPPKTGRPPGVPWSTPKKNPPLLRDLGEFILPGFGGFAATRVISRIATTWTARRKPSWAKHVGVLSSLASFAAAWLLAHRVKQLAKYHTPLVVGSGIATLQTAFQAYVPAKYAWLIGYPTEDTQQLPAGQQQPTGDDLFAEPNDDSYLYDEALDANPPPAQQTAAPSGSAATAAAHAPAQQQSSDTDAVDDILAEMESDSDYQGVFSN